MRSLVILSTLAACSSSSAIIADASLADDIESYDITTWRLQTRMIPRYEPFDTQCAPQGVFLTFPKPGECADGSDFESFPCGNPHSSLEHVMLGGLEPEASPAGAYVRGGSIIGTDVTMEGLGQSASFTVSPVVSLPNPTMTARWDATAKEIRVDWTTDIPADNVLVTFGGYGVLRCLTTGSSYAFPFEVEPAYYEISVQAFAPVETHDTPFGQVRVWRSGEIAGQTGPMH